MKAKLMFVKDSHPLSNAAVRFPAVGDQAYRTDDEGRLDIDLPVATERVEVDLDDTWVEYDFSQDPKASLTVVDTSVRQSGLSHQPTQGFLDLGDTQVAQRFEVAGVLGRGGMGVVVRATDTLLKREVAIKMLNDELSDNEEAEQIFLTEARAMAKLKHPNLVAVHDVLSSNNRTLMVTEFIEGRSLEEVIDEREGLPEKSVLQVGSHLCRAFGYLHAEGIIHRDLKPANVLLQPDGTLKLIDFGLARSLQRIADRGTRVRGTPAYMAPEQVVGDALSERTDLYQIGVTLFEAISGRLPFEDGQMDFAHVNREPPNIADLVPDISAGLAELIHACMAKSPDARPASAEEVGDYIEALRKGQETAKLTAASGQKSPTNPSDPPQQSQSNADSLALAEPSEQATSRPLSTYLIVAILLLAAIGVAGFVALRLSKGNADDDAARQAANSAATTVSKPDDSPPADDPAGTGVADDTPFAANRRLAAEHVAEALAAAGAVSEEAAANVSAAADARRNNRPGPTNAASPPANVPDDTAPTPTHSAPATPEPSDADNQVASTRPASQPADTPPPNPSGQQDSRPDNQRDSPPDKAPAKSPEKSPEKSPNKSPDDSTLPSTDQTPLPPARRIDKALPDPALVDKPNPQPEVGTDDERPSDTPSPKAADQNTADQNTADQDTPDQDDSSSSDKNADSAPAPISF